MREIVVGLSVVLSIFAISYFIFIYPNHVAFSKLSGQIILKQSNHVSVELPLVTYDADRNKFKEEVVYFYDPKFNVNHDEHLIAINEGEDGQQNIVELFRREEGYSYEVKEILYSGKNISFPSFVPNRHAISFVENDNDLIYYDLNTENKTILVKVLPFGFDWLNSDTVLYTSETTEGNRNIMAYSLSSNESSVHIQNVAHPSLSANKRFLAYHDENNTSVIYIKDLMDHSQKMIEINDGRIFPYKPSNDGKYLLGAHLDGGSSDVVMVNIEKNKMKVLIPTFFPSAMDWKE